MGVKLGQGGQFEAFHDFESRALPSIDGKHHVFELAVGTKIVDEFWLLCVIKMVVLSRQIVVDDRDEMVAVNIHNCAQ